MKVRVYNGPEPDSADDSFWRDRTVLEVETFDPQLIAQAMQERDWHMPAGRLFFATKEEEPTAPSMRSGFLFRAEEPTVQITLVTE